MQLMMMVIWTPTFLLKLKKNTLFLLFPHLMVNFSWRSNFEYYWTTIDEDCVHLIATSNLILFPFLLGQSSIYSRWKTLFLIIYYYPCLWLSFLDFIVSVYVIYVTILVSLCTFIYILLVYGVFFFPLHLFLSNCWRFSLYVFSLYLSK